MRDASRRAARPARKGGLPNARFIASGFEQLPVAWRAWPRLVTVHLPWGSLLRAAVGRDADGAAGIARLVAPGGRLRLLLSAADRDATAVAGGAGSGGGGRRYAALGLAPVACRPASADDMAAAHSTWGRRLLSSGRERRTWLIELGAVVLESSDGA